MNKNNNFEKQYETNGIRYQYSLAARKWTFTNGKFTLLTSVRGGIKNAQKVAGFVIGGLKRNNGDRLDNLARANISRFERV